MDDLVREALDTAVARGAGYATRASSSSRART